MQKNKSRPKGSPPINRGPQRPQSWTFAQRIWASVFVLLWIVLVAIVLASCTESQRLPTEAERDRYVPIACETHPNQEACRSLNDKLIVEMSK